MTATRRFRRLWLRVTVVLGALQLFATVLVFIFPFNEDGPLGQRILDIANLSLFIVGRLILTTLFGMRVEGSSATYYLAAAAVTWLFYSALLAPFIFCLVLFSQAKSSIGSRLPELEQAISSHGKRTIAYALAASNLLVILLWSMAAEKSPGSIQHWSAVVITLVFTDCLAFAVAALARRYRHRQ